MRTGLKLCTVASGVALLLASGVSAASAETALAAPSCVKKTAEGINHLGFHYVRVKNGCSRKYNVKVVWKWAPDKCGNIGAGKTLEFLAPLTIARYDKLDLC
ncbi:hypothetical protein ACGF0J_35045 [Nonomuraea sp. NPDC047897]|uniref:hypothetical protein n=1 Tax=Nonomuraea sp. NPDC047897 TaxID=3364346 RepID=UPI003713CCAD